MVNQLTKLTKQEYRIVLDAYIRDFQRERLNKSVTDEEHELYIEIRNRLIKLGEVS